MTDDIGNWFTLLGVLNVLSELALCALSLWVLRSYRVARRR